MGLTERYLRVFGAAWDDIPGVPAEDDDGDADEEEEEED